MQDTYPTGPQTTTNQAGDISVAENDRTARKDEVKPSLMNRTMEVPMRDLDTLSPDMDISGDVQAQYQQYSHRPNDDDQTNPMEEIEVDDP